MWMKRRPIGLVVSLMLAAAGCTGGGIPAPSSSSSPSPLASREERWAEDIDYLVEQMETIHPDLFHGVSKDRFEAAADDLIHMLPDSSDDQILVGVMSLVALISSKGRDGHMGVWPPDNPDAVRRFPIRIWEFPDGLFITAARHPNEDLTGSKIVAVDGVPIDEVFRKLDPVVPRDNASNLRAARTVFLTSAEVLIGLGIADDSSSIQLDVVAPGGKRRRVDVGAVDGDTYADWVGGWELLLPSRPGQLFLRNAGGPFWLEYLAPSRTLYVQYSVVEETSSELVDRIEAATRRHRVDRSVLDLRNNGGGEAGGYRDLLRFLSGPGFDRPGRLCVLIGRLTFSGGASLLDLLERRVPNATVIGEASGGAPNFWADPATVTLPNSELNALVSDRYFGIGGPKDTRLAIQPEIAVALTASDYFSGRDPVLERALSGVDT
jgi:hypothetical protein